ncbi:hypothetical protein CISIN_1g047159mg, partial [Citrus sinensis]
ELLPPMENFMSNQTDITPQMIGICHSCQVHLKFDLMAETLYLMVTLSVKDLISISETYTRDHMLRMEKLMLKKLKFRLNAAQSDTKLEHLAFYLIELSLVQYEALKFKPSLLCASAIYVARCTLQMRYTSYIVDAEI